MLDDQNGIQVVKDVATMSDNLLTALEARREYLESEGKYKAALAALGYLPAIDLPETTETWPCAADDAK